MEILSEGIVLFKHYFLQNEEVIDLADKSPDWRPGTAGSSVNPKLRKTDIHDLDPNTDLHNELLETFVTALNKYAEKYPYAHIKGGEHLRVAKYEKGGFYSTHTDAATSERVISGVLYLNDDYEGGEIYFPSQKIKLKPEAGDLILFPSCFLFPHQSLPITDKSKYAVISWFK